MNIVKFDDTFPELINLIG